VDYVAFGPVFTTESKERPDPTVGIEGLRTAHAINLKPLVAIGGITRDNAPLCWDAGAASVAVIGDLLPYHCTHQTLRERMEEWLRL
jgi:thiamine-phosphate pyrophosphorylase